MSLLEDASNDKKGKSLSRVSQSRTIPKTADCVQILTALAPWIKFIESEEASQFAKIIVANLKRLSAAAKGIQHVLAAVFRLAKDPALCFDHLETFVKIGILEPLIETLRSSEDESNIWLEWDINPKTIAEICDAASDENYHLIQVLVDRSSSAVAGFFQAVTRKPEILKNRQYFAPLASCLALYAPGDLPYDAIITSAIDGLGSPVDDSEVRTAVVDCLVIVASKHADSLAPSISKLEYKDYNVQLAALAAKLAAVSGNEVQRVARHLLHLSLQWIVRQVAEEPSSDSTSAIIDDTVRAIEISSEMELELSLVEPVIISVIQDALDNPSAVKLAAILCARCTLKVN